MCVCVDMATEEMAEGQFFIDVRGLLRTCLFHIQTQTVQQMIRTQKKNTKARSAFAFVPADQIERNTFVFDCKEEEEEEKNASNCLTKKLCTFSN